jgi:hypothetical protein
VSWVLHRRSRGVRGFFTEEVGDAGLADPMGLGLAENHVAVHVGHRLGDDEPTVLEVQAVRRGHEAVAYEKQTNEARSVGVSNCPLCAPSTDNNKGNR